MKGAILRESRVSRKTSIIISVVCIILGILFLILRFSIDLQHNLLLRGVINGIWIGFIVIGIIILITAPFRPKD
ncbi:hypothetical protein KDW_57120 [Dictyobacter vulcani]|uniref:Uncharacterized protein n=1 Tax=Dictyobacter vulcani TaxID=2607529 RepID=A0A5J4KYE6_9CHLR|nr:hypothetical protein KDW_57120 [Dictyobacter vulcani]